jgi:cytochrome c553
MPHRHRYHIIALAVLGLGLLVAAVAMFYWNHANLAVAQEPELPDADGQAVVDYILTGNPYQEWGSWTPDRWTDFGAYIQSGEPHGNTVRIFVNDIAQEAVLTEDFDGTLPPGSLIVKENFMGTPEEPGDLAAITAMYKVEDFNPDANDWFWVKTPGDGSAIDAEGAVEGCINCHSQDGNADYLLRYAFGEEPAVPYGEPLPEADGQAILDYVLQTNDYTTWASWPTDDVNTEDFSNLLPSGEPHGTSVRIFVSDRALAAIARDDFDGILPPGSIVVKENYMGTVEEPGDLAAITIMYKVDGFNPEANDWFWVKAPGDGSAVDAEGAVEGCISCHGQEGNSDYLLRYDLPHPMMDEMEATETPGE